MFQMYHFGKIHIVPSTKRRTRAVLVCPGECALQDSDAYISSFATKPLLGNAVSHGHFPPPKRLTKSGFVSTHMLRLTKMPPFHPNYPACLSICICVRGEGKGIRVRVRVRVRGGGGGGRGGGGGGCRIWF
jgi:hypothetical protein